MEMMRKRWLVAGVGLVVVAGFVWFFFPRRAIAPPPVAPAPSLTESTTTVPREPAATSSSSPVSATPVTLSLAKGDTVVSWNFQGAYTGNAELVAKAQGNIKRFSDLLATATSSTATLLVSIANEYGLLGDGKQEFDYLNRAAAADPLSGLPWHNLGVLMERLGALNTARVAYQKAVQLQPQFGDIQQP